LKFLWIAVQHIKPVLRDHGLNSAGDAIVMGIEPNAASTMAVWVPLSPCGKGRIGGLWPPSLDQTPMLRIGYGCEASRTGEGFYPLAIYRSNQPLTQARL
jgi:hypothetical protein